MKPFAKGVNHREVKYLLKQGKSIVKYLKTASVPIALIVTIIVKGHKAKLIKRSTFLKVEPKHYDFEKKMVKPQCPNSIEINHELTQIKSRVEKSVYQLMEKDTVVSISQIKEAIDRSISGACAVLEEKSVIDHFNEFIKEKEITVKLKTVAKYRTDLNKLIGFEKQSNIELGFSFMSSREFEIAYKQYLIEGYGLRNNTISKHIESLRVFMRWSKEKGYHQFSGYEKFTASREDSDIIYLNQRELSQVENLKLIVGSTEDSVRDMYLFGVYTGQRHSDLANLRWVDIRDDNWYLKQIKGNKDKLIQIPLQPKAAAIIAKQEYRKQKSEFVFTPLSNNYSNRVLKNIMKEAEIDEEVAIVSYSGKKRIEEVFPKWKLVSMHSARRTFVTLSLELGIRPEVVMKFTGHTKLEVLQRYINITDKVKNEELLKAWK